MLKIAICDDEIKIVDDINEYVLKFCQSYNMAFQIHKFYSGKFLVESGLNFDLIFLDVMMNDMNGVDVGKIIKGRDIKTHIVFITGYPDFRLNALEEHAFGYIDKPFDYVDIEKMLSEFYKYITAWSSKEESILLKPYKAENCVERVVKSNDILFFECVQRENKKLKLFTADGEMTIIKGTLTDVYSRLNKTNFAYTNKGCIVNLRYVDSIVKTEYSKRSKAVLMTNKMKVDLSQGMQREFSEKLHNYNDSIR